MAIFILSLIMVSIVSVFVSTVKAYSKAKAMKNLKENIEFAISSIAKDVRMGRIESTETGSSPSSSFMVTLNRSQVKVCYRITGTTLDVCENAGSDCTSCPSPGYKSMINLETGMSFVNSGFYNQRTLPVPPATPTIRGWVEINLNIAMTAGQEMDADSINVQTIVSSRDYGWENVNP